MSAPPKQMPKPDATKKREPKAPLSDKEARAAFGEKARRTLATLARAASATERIMKKNRASAVQLEAFRAGITATMERITNVAAEKPITIALLVPDE